MAVASSVHAVSRPTMLEYAGVLVAIDEIVSLYQHSDSEEQRLSRARSLATLLYVLHDMQCMGLQGSSALVSLAEAVRARAQPVFNAIFTKQSNAQILQAMDNFVYLNNLLYDDSNKTDVVTVALDPTNWIDGEGNPINIQTALSDTCFFDFYRYADATIVSDMGALANRLQASQQFLNALNDVYAGAAWNPGTAYINLQGMLQDYTDSSGTLHSWYDEFTNANNNAGQDNIPLRMIAGVLNIQTMLDNNIFPTDSLEYSISRQITTIFTKSYSTGGYGSVATADAAARMWNDKAFKMTIQNGIDGTTRLNEERQLDLARILTVYDFYVRTATNLVTRENDMNRNVANHIKDI